MTLCTNKTMMMIALTILTTAIFFIDTFVPLGITGSVMYVCVVLVSLWLPSPYAPVITAMVCMVLAYTSLAFLPDGSEWGTVVLNRSLAVFAIWATAIFGSRMKQHIRTLEIREGRLHADIMERKQAEQPQELQQAILQKIVNGNHSQDDILNDLCLHVEHMFPSAFCAILLLDERTGTLKVGAAPSRRETACTILDGLVPGEYAGACGTAVHTRTTVIIEDTETDPRWEPIREAARPLGIKSCWSIPIICEKNRVLGTFAIAHSQGQRPTPQDLQLLETASYLAGITVHRHQTDQNQRKSEERYRDLYESAPLAYFTTGIDGKIISANRQAVELLGGNRADLIGQSVMNLYAPTPHGREKAQRLHEQTQQGKEIVGEELEMQRTDGSHIWVSLTVRLIHDSQGHLIERREIVKEITQRKQTQELQNLQKSALELIVLGEPLSDILNTLCQQVEHMVPLATCSILILDQDEQCLKFRAGPSVPAPLAAALDGMIPGTCAGSCGTATYQGEPVYVSDTATDPLWAHLQDVAKQFHIAACWSYPIITEGKQVLGSLAISLPHPRSPTQSHVQLLETASYLAGISIQRRNTEQAITDSEQRYRALFEDNPSMYFTVAVGGTILSVNQFGAQQLGYTVHELLGKPVSMLLVEEDWGALAEKLVECLKNPQDLQHWEFRKIRKDGQRIWVRETVRVVKDPHHQTVFLIVCDDITLQKQVDTRAFENEQAIRELYEITSSPNRSFEHRVRSLLALGCRRFKLPVGLLTHRIADELELKFVCSSDPAIKEGTRVPLSNPFCSKVMVADTPIGVEHASKSEWRHHPEYPEFKAWPFEAFLGTKVLAGAEPYGTFCFAGPDPYIGTFSDADKDFLQLIARWVGTELEGMKAEAALRKSHTLMNAVLEGTTDAFFVKDLEGRYLMMNAAGKQWVNMTDQDLTGKTDEDIFAPKTVACIQQQDEIILQTGTTQTFEEEVMTNGVKRTFLTTKGPYRDIDGHIIGLFGNVRDITQRKQSEEKLQEIHMALSNAMPGIAQVNPDGCCTEVNDIYASMLGFSGSELVESSWKPTVHPDDISLATTAYQNMMTDGKGEFEARAIRKDGSTFYQHVLLVKRVDAHGDFLGHHCFMRDVTERRQAEEMLRTIIEATSSVVSTDFFHSLLTHLAEALQVKFAFITGCTDSTNTRVRTFAFLQGNDFVENVTYDLAGTPCEQVIQGAIGYYPENVQALFPLDQDLVALKAESYIGLPLQDASGAIIGHIAVMNDRPMPRDTQAESLLKVFAGRAGVELERYRAETALRRSEGRLRQIIDMVPHYIFAKDKNGTFILANQAVADVYGTPLESLIGKTEDDFHLSSEEVLRFRNDDNEVLETGQIKIIQEEQITDSTGKVHFLQTTKIPFVFADTSLPSILGISIDISEQRQAKEQLEDAYERLRDMTTRVKAAEESERKRIARELHDEFGQMLTGLKFDMAWLHRRLSESSPQTSMPPILDKLDSMTRLTDTLIHTVRRIATSLRPSILDDLGLLPALEWQVQDFQNRTGIKCTFSTELDGTTLCLENDHATALFRIAQELFTNILRHAEASSVKLALQKDDGFLTLSVRDNGRGITKHKANKAPSLGLLGIRERVTSFGGDFVIQGKSGKGTHARVRIPLTEKQLT